MQVNFEVGAKAARLIGRENITDVDGALVELIKNSYDADASCVFVKFVMPFPYIPSKVATSEFASKLTEEDMTLIMRYYDKSKDSTLQRKEKLTQYETEELRNILFRYNSILVVDNGSGMDLKTVQESWMYIGTSNKEYETNTKKGRVKTGAKGIGRFALDKLSLSSTMYTKAENSKMVNWKLDWEKFSNSKLLKDVKAEIDIMDMNYEQTVQSLLGDDFADVKEYNWTNGTAFILHPIREEWSERLFSKVNTNLKSINPLGSVDEFYVHVKNKYFSKYNYITEKVAIGNENFDYCIKVEYDGDMSFTVKLLRNEVDINKKVITLNYPSKSYSFSLDEFWERPIFKENNYKKSDYNKEISFNLNVTKILKNDDIEKIKKVGNFSSVFYFLKKTKSEFEIIKSFNAKKRKELLNKFSGIKLYRDKFKVRPYGDEGALYDWIGLGSRANESPGGVASKKGAWRVLPYQIIGQVNISRFSNELLFDMANREGLVQNDTYHIFIDLLIEAFKLFENDRQLFYIEYSKWIDDLVKRISIDDQLKATVKQKMENKLKLSKKIELELDNEEETKSDSEDETQNFTEDQYQETVYNMMKEAEEQLNAKQILQLLSSSGLILNTFFHEFKAISSHFGSRAPQLRRRINHLLNGEEYHGSLVYNPYVIIDAMQTTDEMLETWLDVAMQGIEKESLEKNSNSIKDVIKDLTERWIKLLHTKDIDLNLTYDEEQKYQIEMPLADIYIILNNFLLNSVWFLEKNENDNRHINIKLSEDQTYIRLNLENNGPQLEEKYTAVPNRIFELGETSKKRTEGTGVGLWVTKEVVERNNGTILVDTEKTDGFGLRILLKK